MCLIFLPSHPLLVPCFIPHLFYFYCLIVGFVRIFSPYSHKASLISHYPGAASFSSTSQCKFYCRASSLTTADNIDCKLLPSHLSELASGCHWAKKGKVSMSVGGMSRSMQKISQNKSVFKTCFQSTVFKVKLLTKEFFSLTNTEWL